MDPKILEEKTPNSIRQLKKKKNAKKRNAKYVWKVSFETESSHVIYLLSYQYDSAYSLCAKEWKKL